MLSDPSRILIFDSGVGALSVFQEILLSEPHTHYSLVLDNAHFPYGTIEEPELIARVVKVIQKLIPCAKPDLIVIACNTASTLVLEELRKQFDVPFVGVVPAIKPAARLSGNQTIGLLATPATVDRSYTESLIEEFAPECEILRVGSTELVYMAEQKLRGKPVDKHRLKEIMAPFIDHPKCDTLVLACTHFPLLKDELNEVLPERIKLLDSGAAIAQRVSSLRKKNGLDREIKLENGAKNVEPHKFYSACPDSDLQDLTLHFSKSGFRFAQSEVIVP